VIKFNKPINLNGTELREELNAAGVNVSDKRHLIILDANSELWIDVSESDKTKTEAVVAAHNGTTVAPEPTIEQKLASVGLNLEDLKSALGL
jgi:hypothetical protein